MRTAFITTINTNIGDDFIRTGIENLIKSVRGSKTTNYTYVNKHFPETALLNNSPLHFLNRLPDIRGKQRLINMYYRYFNKYFTVFKQQDLIIQSGAPVLWPNCDMSEWAQPIWYDTIGKMYNEIPVLNLAAGSCYPWENQNGFMSEQEATFAKNIGTFCKLTTTRDVMANRLFSQVGIKNELLPCTALMVDPNFENQEEGKYILVNYMHGGGHFDWDQNIDPEIWASTMKKCISELSVKHEVRFICHNQKEIDQAKMLYPELKIHMPTTIDEYISCIRHAKVGINNRMHASMAMASVGIPSISVGTDTRLLMPELIGLPVQYVKVADFNSLLNQVNSLIDNLSQEKKRLFELKKSTSERYKELLRQYVS